MTEFSTLVVTTNFAFASVYKDYLDSEGRKGVIATPASLNFKDGKWLHVLHTLVTEVTKPEYIKNVVLLIEETHSEFTDLPSSVFGALWEVFKNQHTIVTVINSAMHHYEVNSRTRAAYMTHERIYKVLGSKHTAKLLLLEHFGLSDTDEQKTGEQTYRRLIDRASILQALDAPFLTTAIYGP